MSDIEKFTREHHDEFDTFEPEAGHFERFESRLQQQPVIRIGHHRSAMLKVAALILILISVSVFAFDFATREIRNRFASGKTGSELPVEICEAVQYYDNQTNAQLLALSKLTSGNTEALKISESAIKEIRNLDDATADLKNNLSASPGNEHILDAIIRNQQLKEIMLNNIINQLSLYQK